MGTIILKICDKCQATESEASPNIVVSKVNYMDDQGVKYSMDVCNSCIVDIRSQIEALFRPVSPPPS